MASVRNRWTLGALLLASVVAAVWVHEAESDARPESATVEVVAPRHRAAAPRSGAPRVNLEKLESTPMKEMSFDPFTPPVPPKPKTPPVVAAAPAPPPPAPAPVAPPLPFTYFGRLAVDDDRAVFLSSGERNLIVRPGEVIDGTYRVDSVSDAQIVFTYLPLNLSQQLAIGSAQ